MNTVKFTANVNELELPQSYSLIDWMDFFNKLEGLDPYAPFHAVAGRYHFTSDEKYEVPPSMFGNFYHNLAIEMCADDRYPADEAAIRTGFFQRGIDMIVAATIADGGRNRNLLMALREMFKYRSIESCVRPELVPLVEELLNKDTAYVEGSDKVGRKEDDRDVNCLVKFFEGEMMEDINASAALVGYFLRAEIGHDCSIFCPLGYAPYKEIGKKMSEDPVVLEAAKTAGLLASGIPTYVQAALSNEDCWECMVDGVAHLLDRPDLSCFIPFRDRFIAEHMVVFNDRITAGEEDWADVYQYPESMLNTEWVRGY